MADLSFSVTALDKATATFLRLAEQVDRLAKKIDKLDGKKATAEVEVKTDKAERQVGAFATNLRKRLEAATKALPEIEIGANGTKAEQALAKVRADMKTLGDKKIGVDISAEKALAEVKRIKGELASIANDKTATVDVKADVGSALAALKTVDAEVKSLDGKKATVKVATDKSWADSLIQVNLLGRALRAIALPAAALAVSPQIASLGAAAVSATGALGVLPAALGAVGLAAGVASVSFGNLLTYFTADSAKKQAAAYAALSGSGQHLADTIKGLTPQFVALRSATQDAVFAGMAAQVKPLAALYLPALKTQMVEVGRSFNVATLSVAKFFQQKNVSGDMTASLMSMRLAVTNVVLAARPLAQVLVDVITTGAARLPGLTKGIADAAAHFAGFITAARQSGQLGQWMDQGIKTVKELGQSVLNVGSILLSVFRAAQSAGGSLTQTLAEVTGQIAAVLKSAQGQEALVAFFAGIRSVVAGLGPVVVALVPTVVALAKSLQVGLAAAVAAVVPVVQALAPLLTGLATAAGPVLTTVINALAGPLRNIAAAITGALLPVLPPVGDALVKIALAVAPMITQLDALAPAFGAVARAGAALLQFLGPFLAAMSSTFGGAIAAVVPAIVAVADGLTTLLHVLTPIAPMLGIAAAAFGVFKTASAGISVAQGALAAVATKISDVALNSGVMTEKLTGSAGAGEKVASAGGKLADGLGKVGAALPFVGAGVVLLSLAYDQLSSKADVLASKVLDGSATFQQAVTQETATTEQRNTLMSAMASSTGEVVVAQDAQAAATDNVTAAIDKQRAAMSPMQQLQADVARAQADLNDAVAQFGPKSDQASSAAAALAGAHDRLKGVTDGATAAEKSLGDQIVTTTQQAAGAANADIGYQQSLLTLKDAQDAAAKAAADHTTKASDLERANLAVQTASLAAAAAAQTKAEADAKAAGMSNVAQIGAQAYKEELLRQAETMTGPAKQATIDLANGIAGTGGAADAAKLSAHLYGDQLQHLADQTNGPMKAALEEGKRKLDEIAASHGTATDKALAQRTMLERLAAQTTGPTHDAIMGMIRDLGSIPKVTTLTVHGVGDVSYGSPELLRAAHGGYTGGIIGMDSAGLTGVAYADGGVTPGYTPGRDVHRFSSATGGTLDLSGGEAIMRPEWTAAVGTGFVNGANAAARSGGVGGVRKYMATGRYAAGGIVPHQRFADGGVQWTGTPLPAIPGQLYNTVAGSLAHTITSTINTAIKALAAQAAAQAAAAARSVASGVTVGLGGGGGRAYIIAHESGGNPTAQNPVSSASGLYQMIDGTWHAYGGREAHAKQGSVAEQNAVADRYVAARYGSWDAAAAYWQVHHNYDRGGMLMPGNTLATNATGAPERVLTPEQTRAYDSVATRGGNSSELVGLLRAVVGQLGALRGDVDHHGDQAGIAARLDVTNRLLASSASGSAAMSSQAARTASELGAWV